MYEVFSVTVSVHPISCANVLHDSFLSHPGRVGGRAERRNLLRLDLYIWSSWAVIQMFQLVSAKHVNQGPLRLQVCPLRKP